MTEVHPTDDRLLTEKELAADANVSERSVQRWRQTGEGPPYVRIGVRRVAYPESLHRKWLASRTYPHRAAELAKSAA